jgi:MFS-type transporter involved in bile tolerance (Atg22 family)
MNLGAMVGALGFGILTLIFGMSNSFVVIGIVIFLIASVGIIKRFHLFSSKLKA